MGTEELMVRTKSESMLESNVMPFPEMIERRLRP